MKSQKLSADEARELFNYDPETGALTWRVRKGRAKPGQLIQAKGTPAGHILLRVNQANYWAHRLVWLIVHGHWPRDVIDHINGNPSDNRLSNLRDVPQAVNRQNLHRARSDSKTGLMGVRREGEKFTSRIYVRGVEKHLGTFTTTEAAHQAYLTAKRELHAGCTI